MVLFFSLLLDMRERTNEVNSFMAGISSRNIRIMMKFKMITSLDGAEPRNNAAKIRENIIIYMIAMEARITMYERTLSQIDARLSARNFKIV